MPKEDVEDIDLASFEKFLVEHPKNVSDFPLPGGTPALLISPERYHALLVAEWELDTFLESEPAEELSDEDLLEMLDEQLNVMTIH